MNKFITNSLENVALIPREELFSEPEYSNVQISPDGKYLSYLSPYEGNRNIWVRDLKTGREKVLTTYKRPVLFYTWLNSSIIGVYMDKDGNENYHINAIDIESGEIRDLTPFEDVKCSILKRIPEFQDKVVIEMNLRDKSVFEPYLLDLRNGELTLLLENPGNVSHWFIDNSLTPRIAALSLENGKFEYRIIENGKIGDVIIEIPAEDSLYTWVSNIYFTKDNKKIYMETTYQGNTKRIILLDLESGKYSVFFEDPDFDISMVLKDPIDHEILAVLIQGEKPVWKVLNSKVKEDFDKLEEFFGADAFIIRSQSDDNKLWIISRYSDTKPIEFYIYNRQKKEIDFLFSSYENLRKYEFSKMEPISFIARDGMKIYGYLTLPVNLEPKNLPTIIFVHGGPWSRDEWYFSPWVQWLANRGYAVLQVNFRGSWGYGKNYLNAGDREWGGKMQNDLIDGLLYLIEKGITDPNRVGIMGGSYGGYATLVGLTFTPEYFKCGVSIVGPSNLITFFQTIPPYWKTYKSVFYEKIGHPEKDKEFLISRSPYFHAKNLKSPLMIIHGANDVRVNLRESEMMFKAAKENGVEAILVVYPDEGHGIVRYENRLDMFGRIEEFLAKYLGGRFEPFKEIPNSSVKVYK